MYTEGVDSGGQLIVVVDYQNFGIVGHLNQLLGHQLTAPADFAFVPVIATQWQAIKRLYMSSWYASGMFLLNDLKKRNSLICQASKRITKNG